MRSCSARPGNGACSSDPLGHLRRRRFNKRPPASDADDQLIDSHQASHGAAATEGDDAATKHSGQQSKQQQQQQLECPRCQSTNTKFCYYNNYSTAQPRHFCRACRRYWTHGGTLRDVPVGGASRRPSAKRRRLSLAEAAEPSSSSASASASPPASAGVVDAASAYLPDLSAFPFLSDGSFLPPQFDLGAAAPAAFSSWPHSVVPDFYDGLAPWDDGTVGVGAAAGITGAWGDIAGLELSWPPPGN